MMKFGSYVHCTKISSEFEFGGHRPRLWPKMPSHYANNQQTDVGVARVAVGHATHPSVNKWWSCVVGQFYAGGKISAWCLVCFEFIYHHNHNCFTTLFPGPPGCRAGARRELLDFMVQGKTNRGRHTDHLDGRHSIWTKHCPPPLSSTIKNTRRQSLPRHSVESILTSWCFLRMEKLVPFTWKLKQIRGVGVATWAR